MASFYSPGDQELYKQFQYLPQEQFRLGLNLPKNTEAEAVNTTFGIPATNAFTNNRGGALQVGDPMMNFDNYYNYTGNKYMMNQNRPNLDSYSDNAQKTFMGFPSYQQQELTGPDRGEYIGSGTNIPLEKTMAGTIQSKLQDTGEGIKSLMGNLPTFTNLLNKIGVQNFSSLSPADQLFIKTNTGYRGPTVFGENTGGGNVDPFGLNVESVFGNYAGAVRDNFDQLQGTLTKDRPGVTFNELTGEFEGEDEDLVAKTNKQTEMIRNKFLFRRAQVNQQKKNERDLIEKQKVQAEIDRKERERVGAVQGLLDEGSYVSRDRDGYSASDRAVGGGAQGRAANMDNDRSTGTSQGYSQHYKKGGLASIL